MALIWCDNCVLERNNFSVNGTNCILNYCRCIRLSSQHWWNSVKSYLHVFVACCWWLNWCRALFIAFDFSIRAFALFIRHQTRNRFHVPVPMTVQIFIQFFGTESSYNKALKCTDIYTAERRCPTLWIYNECFLYSRRNQFQTHIPFFSLFLRITLI